MFSTFLYYYISIGLFIAGVNQAFVNKHTPDLPIWYMIVNVILAAIMWPYVVWQTIKIWKDK